MKQLIYRNKCLKKRITIYEFNREIELLRIVKAEIARSKNKVKLHSDKWVTSKINNTDNERITNIDHFIEHYVAQM